MKAALRALKNHAYSYADVEVKVREATSNDPWSCPPSLLRELARATHDYQDYPKLFAMLWKRLADVEHVLHVQKALTLLHFLLLHGSERFALDVKRRARDVSALTKYRHYDANNVDDAKEARQKAKAVFELLSNEQRLVADRASAEKSSAAGGLNPEEEEEEEQYRQRRAAKAASKAKRGTADEDEGDVEAEEKRPSSSRVRTAKPKAAVKASAAAAGPKKAGDDFTAVSEEEMTDEEEKEASGEGGKRVRQVKRTVRKVKTESVQEGADDERVRARDEEREETTTTTRGAKSGHQGSAVAITTTAVRGSRSTLQADGTTATSAYATIATQDPIPIDDLLTSSAALAGGKRGGAARDRAVERPLEDDLDPVSGELDLMSLASRPNVVYLGNVQQAPGAELDMLTGQPVVSAPKPRVKARPLAAAPAPAAAAPSLPRKASTTRAVAREPAPAPAPSAVSAKRQQLLAQLAALEGEEGVDDAQPGDDLPPDDYAPDDLPEVRAAPSRSQPASRPARKAAAAAPRAAARPPPRAVEEAAYDEYGAEEEGEYEEPALLDRLPPSAAAPAAVLRPTSGRGVTISAPRAVQGGASVDLWQQQGGLMDLDHLGAEQAHTTPMSRAKPRRAAPAEAALSMAEMQSAAAFPSVTSLAMSDDSLTSAFARKPQQARGTGAGAAAAARGNAGLSMGDFVPAPSRTTAQRGRQPPASTDIFFQS